MVSARARRALSLTLLVVLLASSLVPQVAVADSAPSAGLLGAPKTAASATPLVSETMRDAYLMVKATDSASAATAISTGYKTDDGNLAWLPGDPDGGALTTIAQKLRSERGFAIGVASTVQFSHATPAGFVSHNKSRNNYADIANEIISTVTPDVVIGGGHPLYNSDSDHFKYVGGAATWAALNSGATAYTNVVTRTAGVDGGAALIASAETVELAAGDKLMGVFGGSGNNFEYHVVADNPGSPSITRGSIENPLLKDIVTATLGVLSQDTDGLFVMFEQGDIDWSNHANDYENMVGGVWDLDEAVKQAEAFIDQPGGMDWSNTLVIVTSDHSNSYMRNRDWLGLGDLPAQSGVTYPGGEVTYQSPNHTNELVTLWARGEGAELFAEAAGAWYADDNIVDNTQIHQVMIDAVEQLGVKNVVLFIGDGMNIEHEVATSRYLYGVDQGLSWHAWRNLSNGWGGYCSTWDVTTYNYWAAQNALPVYSIGAFDALVGYDPIKGGSAPYPLQPALVELTVSPTSLYVELDADGTATQTVAVTKVGSGNANWSLVEEPTATWVAATPESSAHAYDGTLQLAVNVSAANLVAGYYRTDLTLRNPYLDVSIPVVLRVRATGATPVASTALNLSLLGSYRPVGEGASEIVAYDPGTQQLYVTNGSNSRLDVLGISSIATVPTPTLVSSIDLSAYGAGVTSVACMNGLVAAAVPADPKTNNGVVVLIQGANRLPLTVGALPDMLTFTPDGSKLLVANEGEPSDDYSVDPEGSISVIDVSGGIAGTSQADVTTLGFAAFNAPAAIDPAIRIYGPNASVAQDLEPEYIAVSPDSTKAWVTLQENNALAFVNLTTLQVTDLVALGTKDWSALGMDVSDKDGGINLANWEVLGLFQPDGIAAYTVRGATYLVTANEGDVRDYDGYSEEARIGDLTLDPTRYPEAYADAIQAKAALGRLKTTTATAAGDNNLYTFGGRSFSIWNATTGALVFDSGSDLERITASQIPDRFNADSGDPALVDTRSDDKGPEPESVVLGVIGQRTYAFIALERGGGGVMIYDVTNPFAPVFANYVPQAEGDVSPEGLDLIPAHDSPTGKPLLAIAYELTGSTSVYEIGVGAMRYTVRLPMLGK